MQSIGFWKNVQLHKCHPLISHLKKGKLIVSCIPVSKTQSCPSVLEENIHQSIMPSVVTLNRLLAAYTVRAVRCHIYVFCHFTPFRSLLFGIEFKWQNTRHDFPRDFPASITTISYAAADDYNFGNQKVKMHQQRFTKPSVLKNKNGDFRSNLWIPSFWLFTLFLYSLHSQALSC